MQEEEELLEQAHGRFEHAMSRRAPDAEEVIYTRTFLMRSANVAMLNELHQLAAQYPGFDIDEKMQNAGLRSEPTPAHPNCSVDSRPGTAASLAHGIAEA